MKYFLAFFLMTLTQLGFSQTSDKCNFEITCENEFKLEFKSKSGSCVEDDTSIQFSNSKITVSIPGRMAWYYEMENIGNSESTCKSTHYPSYPLFIKKDQALVFIRKNGRPGYDLIVAILIDSKTGNVLDDVEIGRYMRSTFGILKYKNGYKMRMVSGSTKDMKCDCDASTDEAWIEVKIENNKIKKNWLKQKNLK